MTSLFRCRAWWLQWLLERKAKINLAIMISAVLWIRPLSLQFCITSMHIMLVMHCTQRCGESCLVHNAPKLHSWWVCTCSYIAVLSTYTMAGSWLAPESPETHTVSGGSGQVHDALKLNSSWVNSYVHCTYTMAGSWLHVASRTSWSPPKDATLSYCSSVIQLNQS